MSNQRSFVLFVALIAIVSYLYYESISETGQTSDLQNPLDNKTEFENVKPILNISPSRRLLFIDEEPDFKHHEDIQTNKNDFLIKNSIDKVKPNETFYWDFNINVTRLQKLLNSKNKAEKLKEQNKAKSNWMKLSVYVSGNESKSTKELKLVSLSVEQLVEKLFGQNLSEEIIVDSFSNSVTKNKSNSTTKKQLEKKSKFLPIFNFGENNKENPPLELGSGENEPRNETLTEKMQTIAFIDLDITATEKQASSDNSSVVETVSNNNQISDRPNQLSFEDVSETTVCTNCFSDDKSDILKNTDVLPLNEIPISTAKSTENIEEICLDILSNIQKSGLIEELSENVVESSEDTLDHTTEKSAQSGSSGWILLQSIWNRIGFRTVNGNTQSTSKLTKDEVTEKPNKTNITTNLPDGFSIKDCREFFMKSNNSSETAKDINQTIPLLEVLSPKISIVTELTTVSNLNEFSSQFTKLSSLSPEEMNIIDITKRNSENEQEPNSLSTISVEALDNQIFNESDSLQTMKENFNLHLTSTLKSKETELSNSNKSGRFFNEFDEDLLELGSSDEGRIFGGVFSSGERKIKESDFEEKFTLETGSDRSLSSIFNFGSGSREIIKTDLSKKDTLNTNSALEIFSERSILPLLNFGSGSREVVETDWSDEGTVNMNSSNAEKSFDFFDSGGSGSIFAIELSSDSETSKTTQSTFNEMVNFEFTSKITQESFKTNKSLDDVTHFSLNLNEEGNDSQMAIEDTNVSQELFPHTFSENLDPRENWISNDTDLKKFLATSNACNNCERSELPVTEPYVFKEITVNDRLKNELQITCKDCNSQFTNIESTSNFPNLNLRNVDISDLNSKNISKSEDATSSVNLLKSTNIPQLDFKINPITSEDDNDLNSSQNSMSIKSNEIAKATEVSGLPFNDPKPSRKSKSDRGARANDFTEDWSFFTTIPISKPTEISSKIFNFTKSSQNPQAGRGARAHNFPQNWSDFISETKSESTSSALPTKLLPVTEIASEIDITLTELMSVYKTSVSTKDTEISISTTEDSKEKFQTSNKFITSSEVPSFNSTLPTITTTTRTNLKINPVIKPSVIFCQSARECNSSLNERCISKEEHLICDCGRAFVRNPETKKCEGSVTIQTSMKLPGEKFDKDLKDPTTKLYEKKEQDAMETMWNLLHHDVDLFRTVAEIDVAGFEEGSLVVKWNLRLVSSGNISDQIEELNENLGEIIKNDSLLKNVPLNMQNASSSIIALDPCMQKDLNYCHKNAKCLVNDQGGFKCVCDEGYMDNSRDQLYQGEICIAACTPYYCGDHGECRLNSNGERHCLCAGWFFGKKCEMSGIVVIGSFTAANVVVIIIVLILVCCIRKRKRNYYDGNISAFQPGPSRSQKVSDVIALDTIDAKGSKFVVMSTPSVGQAPAIQITSPSFPGSSLDYDSTFDRSRCMSDESSKNEYDFAQNV